MTNLADDVDVMVLKKKKKNSAEPKRRKGLQEAESERKVIAADTSYKKQEGGDEDGEKMKNKWVWRAARGKEKRRNCIICGCLSIV